jgi:hypothetical protein
MAILLVEEGIHNISSRLVKQLVLELEVGVVLLESVDELPRCFTRRLALPLHQELPRIFCQPSTHHLIRLWYRTASNNGKQCCNC